MKPMIVAAELVFPSSSVSDRKLDPERVARVSAELFQKLIAETSGPVEGLAVLRIAARLIREIMTTDGVSADSQEEVLKLSSEMAQSIKAMIHDGPMPMFTARGGES